MSKILRMRARGLSLQAEPRVNGPAKSAQCGGAEQGDTAVLVRRRRPHAWLEEITSFTAAGFTNRLTSLVLCAYTSGCTLPQVLAAIEAGQALGDLPSAALRPAWERAHAWAWIARHPTPAIADLGDGAGAGRADPGGKPG